MFNSDVETSNQIDIEDIFAECLQQFLQLFTQKNVEFTDDCIGGVLQLIKKINVGSLLEMVQHYTQSTVTKENVWLFFDLAHSHRFTVTLIEQFKQIICKSVLEIMKSDDLVCNEQNIFDALLEWAIQKLRTKGIESTGREIRKELGPLLQQIRFPTMTFAQLLTNFENYPDLLSVREFVDMAQYITTGRPLTIAAGFNTTSRSHP